MRHYAKSCTVKSKPSMGYKLNRLAKAISSGFKLCRWAVMAIRIGLQVDRTAVDVTKDIGRDLLGRDERSRCFSG
jgi:hypothetical protein